MLAHATCQGDRPIVPICGAIGEAKDTPYWVLCGARRFSQASCLGAASHLGCITEKRY
jgi:hypothetical protein